MGKSKKQKQYGRVRKSKKRADDEVDFDTLVKQEFLKLHRQNRLLEDARHAIIGQSGKLSRQGQILEFLQAEKESLLTDIKNCTCLQMRRKDENSIKIIKEALERYEKYKSDIQACFLSIREMESNVDRIVQRLIEQKLKVQALYGQTMTVAQADHRKRVLENRLYLVTTQFDTLVSRNKYLKNEINMMLRLRGNFYQRLLNIKRASVRVKRRMGEIVIEAKAAYDERDEGANKINMLRDKNDRDSKMHILEIKEFQRVLHHDSKIHEFLTIKNKERQRMEEGADRIERKQQEKIKNMERLLIAYKRAFRSLLRMANAKNMEELVTTYLTEEQKNFGFFKVITKLNHEMMFLQDDILKTKQEIDRVYKMNRRAHRNQENSLTLAEQELEETSGKLEALIAQKTEAYEYMKKFGHLIDEALTISGADNTTIIESLGKQEDLGIENIPLCLKVLEQRVQDLIFEKSVLELRKTVELEHKPVTTKPPGPMKTADSALPLKPSVHITGGRVDAGDDEGGDDSGGYVVGEPTYWEDMFSNLYDLKQVEKGTPSQLALEDVTQQGSYTHFTMSKISIHEGPSTFFPPVAEEPEPELVPLSPPPPFTTPPPKRIVEYVPEVPVPIARPSQQVDDIDIAAMEGEDDEEEGDEEEEGDVSRAPSVMLPGSPTDGEEGGDEEEESTAVETASEAESQSQIPSAGEPPTPGDEEEEEMEGEGEGEE